jgi:hypothetical protein
MYIWYIDIVYILSFVKQPLNAFVIIFKNKLKKVFIIKK